MTVKKAHTTAKLCGAKTRAGGICRQPALPNGRCRFHGGKSLAGIASPTFKTGRYSKYLPARLQEKYQEALKDGELLALREEVSLVDARIVDLLKQVDSDESGVRWLAARAATKNLAAAIRARKPDAAKTFARLAQLEEVFEHENDDQEIWGEILVVIEQRRKLVESERRRLIELQQVITVERAMLLIGAVTDVIRRNVTDLRTLSAISQDLQVLLNRADTPALAE